MFDLTLVCGYIVYMLRCSLMHSFPSCLPGSRTHAVTHFWLVTDRPNKFQLCEVCHAQSDFDYMDCQPLGDGQGAPHIIPIQQSTVIPPSEVPSSPKALPSHTSPGLPSLLTGTCHDDQHQNQTKSFFITWIQKV